MVESVEAIMTGNLFGHGAVLLLGFDAERDFGEFGERRCEQVS